jgi:hypothetical protein
MEAQMMTTKVQMVKKLEKTLREARLNEDKIAWIQECIIDVPMRMNTTTEALVEFCETIFGEWREDTQTSANDGCFLRYDEYGLFIGANIGPTIDSVRKEKRRIEESFVDILINFTENYGVGVTGVEVAGIVEIGETIPISYTVNVKTDI